MAKILVITGPSGFRKSDVHKAILKVHPKLVKVISYTDRPPKAEEIHGVDFKFISQSKFTKMIEEEKFLEWQRVLANNYRYGKTKKDFLDTLKKHGDSKIITTIINIVNVPVFKRAYPESKVIYLDVDNQTLIETISKSNITNPEDLQRKLKFALEERKRRHLADFYLRMENIEDLTEVINKLLNLIDDIFK